MSHDVIMPALGMAQETGLILAWRKKPGEAVKAGDILMEVETDKAAMEVEAQADGFLTDVRAREGEDVPVGEVIAVISDSAADRATAPGRSEEEPKREPPEPVKAGESSPGPAPKPENGPAIQPDRHADGRLLASPKARRLAKERGLDLERLARAGHPQPYRVADLEVLVGMQQGGSGNDGERMNARASVEAEAFNGLTAWLASECGATRGMVLACFAAGSLRVTAGSGSLLVQLSEPRKQPRLYLDPDLAGLSGLQTAEPDRAPDLIVYDLTETRLTSADLAAPSVPTLTVARDGGRLVVSLAAVPDRLDDEALIACLDGFAGRLEEPLRQLL